MNLCQTNIWGGQGECFALQAPIAGAILLEKDHTAITKAAVKTLTGLRTAITPATFAGVAGVVLEGHQNGTEPSGGENEITASNTNGNVLTNVSAPVLTLFAKMTYADYISYYSMEGKSFKMGLLDMEKSLYGTNASDTNFTGFRCHFYLKHGLPMGTTADKVKSYPFYIYFDDTSEWGKNLEILRTDYSFMEATQDVNPAGLDISVLTPITETTGLVTIQVYYRGTHNPYTAFTAAAVAAEWAIRSTIDAGTTVTMAVGGDSDADIGQYELTILCTAGDITGDVVLQAYKLSTAPVVTHLSNALTINKYTA